METKQEVYTEAETSLHDRCPHRHRDKDLNYNTDMVLLRDWE